MTAVDRKATLISNQSAPHESDLKHAQKITARTMSSAITAPASEWRGNLDLQARHTQNASVRAASARPMAAHTIPIGIIITLGMKNSAVPAPPKTITAPSTTTRQPQPRLFDSEVFRHFPSQWGQFILHH